MLTLVASALAGGDCIDDAGAACRWDGRCSRLRIKAPSTLGTFLRSFRWGHVSTRPREQLLARASSRGRTAAPDHRPGLPICETYGLATRAIPASVAIRCWPLPPAPRRADGGCARARPTPFGALDSCGSRVRSQGTTHGAGRQRFLYPRHRRRLPPDGCPLLHHHPARQPAQSHEAIPEAGRPFLTGWTVPPMWPRPPTPPSRVRRTPRRCGSSSGG